MNETIPTLDPFAPPTMSSVKPNGRPATRVRRFWAQFLDIGLYAALVSVPLYVDAIVLGSAISRGIGFPLYIGISVGFLVWCAAWEASSFRATPGKLAVRIEVQLQDGGRAGFAATASRNFFKNLLLVIGMGVVVMFLVDDKTGKSAWDSNTRVMRR